jgi:multidrug efflux system membrane fusion protein
MSTIPPSVSSPKPEESPAKPVPSTPSLRPLSPAPGQPEVRSSIWWTILGWSFVAVLGAAGWHYQERLKPFLDPILGHTKEPAPRPPRVVPVTTAVVKRRDLPLYLNGLGTVTAFKTVTLRSRVEGELMNVAFTEGQMVTEGDLLAEIDPRPFEVQLARAESQLASDQAGLKTAKSTLSRYEGLLASKSISPQQYDEQATIVQQTMATIQLAEAMIADARLQLTYCRITAPISGRIGLRLVDRGNIVRASDPNGLALITQLQPIALIFTIPQDDIGRVQQRSLAGEPLQVDAYDREFRLKLTTGELLAIDNQVDSTTGTVRLKAQFTNKDGMLFPNQFVNARLLVDTLPNAIVVPSAAIQRGPTSMYVYVVKADDTVELRYVVTGASEGSETSIESGLSEGEIVVTDGLDKLQPEAKVAPRRAGQLPETEAPETEAPATGKDPAQIPPQDDATPNQAPVNAVPSTDPKPVPATADQGTSRTLDENSVASPSAEARPKVACGETDAEIDATSPDGKDTP